MLWGWRHHVPYRQEARVLDVALRGNEIADPHGHVRQRVDVGINVAFLHLTRITRNISKTSAKGCVKKRNKNIFKNSSGEAGTLGPTGKYGY